MCASVISHVFQRTVLKGFCTVFKDLLETARQRCPLSFSIPPRLSIRVCFPWYFQKIKTQKTKTPE